VRVEVAVLEVVVTELVVLDEDAPTPTVPVMYGWMAQ
jgi:hypothetical protein